jgi:YidC/Oxa1 family membrane protein insertase
MRLYQEAGVNPLSGCLPLVIQMPILFGLYAALVAVGPMLQNAGFFWIPDLSYPQYSMGLNWIPALWEQGNYATLIGYLILPVLLVVTQFVMQKWMTPTPVGADDSQAKMTQNMTLFMTLFFGFFTLQVPAGLTLYWVTSNLLQMLQQWGVTKFLIKPAAAGAAASGSGATTGAVTVDGKASKVTTGNGGATTSTAKTSAAGANGSGSARTTTTSAPAGTTAATKASKPSNRPKAKGK